MSQETEAAQVFQQCKDILQNTKREISKRIVAQDAAIDGILTSLIVGGHVLLEGVPGLAKTLMVKTFSDITGLSFKRIQFTPDLLPADITGTMIYEQHKGTFSVRKGPVFANMVLADEINRAPAKVQSALLEAMAEGQVTIGEESYALPQPFFVLATQNPIEQEGTYNLPEAELDRFLMKINLTYPTAMEEVSIVKGEGKQSLIPVAQTLSEKTIMALRQYLEMVACDEKLVEYIVSIVAATRPVQGTTTRGTAVRGFTAGAKNRDDIHKYIAFGASPRAGIALCRCAKAAALCAGRSFVLPEDIKSMAPAVLRHRIVLSYEAAAEGVTADDLIARILSLMPVP